MSSSAETLGRVASNVEHVSTAIGRLDGWIEKEAFKGWGVYDALNSPLLKALTFGSRLLGIGWVQLLKQSPINLRSLLGVSKGYNPKGMGLFLASYVRKHQIAGDERHIDRIEFFTRWLKDNVSPGYSGACWGYNFDWPNRGFFAPAGTPTVVNTAFIGLAFLDGHRVIDLGAQPTGEEALSDSAPATGYLSTARSACGFLLDDVNQTRPKPDELCFSYTPLDRRYIHNANLLGAWLLAEVCVETGEPVLAEHALAAARYTARRQRQDGAWLYGEGKRDQWVDSFHTGFVLAALKHVAACLKTKEFDDAIARGYRFWKGRMFLPDGTPKYYPESTYPIDVHSVAQAILAFLEFTDRDPEAEEWAWRVALWGVDHMQDSEGYFHYQIKRYYRIRIPYMRWSQAWMQRALTELLWHAEQGAMA
jgi:hypothetical protein